MEIPALKILYEDDSLIAVEKISGIPSHTLADPAQITIELLLKQLKPEIPELAPAHRLDTGTSGVLIFCKNLNTYQLMREKFKNREIEKYYVAWSSGEPTISDFPFLISTPLAHHPKSKKRMVALPPGKKISYRGKPLAAETIVHSIDIIKKEDKTTVNKIHVQILTGVTHQIRVHLASIGLPLLNDPIYLRDHSGEGRLGLHAERVKFNFKGKNIEIFSKPDYPV